MASFEQALGQLLESLGILPGLVRSLQTTASSDTKSTFSVVVNLSTLLAALEVSRLRDLGDVTLIFNGQVYTATASEAEPTAEPGTGSGGSSSTLPIAVAVAAAAAVLIAVLVFVVFRRQRKAEQGTYTIDEEVSPEDYVDPEETYNQAQAARSPHAPGVNDGTRDLDAANGHGGGDDRHSFVSRHSFASDDPAFQPEADDAGSAYPTLETFKK